VCCGLHGRIMIRMPSTIDPQLKVLWKVRWVSGTVAVRFCSFSRDKGTNRYVLCLAGLGNVKMYTGYDP
jgi:hypothetical protein